MLSGWSNNNNKEWRIFTVFESERKSCSCLHIVLCVAGKMTKITGGTNTCKTYEPSFDRHASFIYPHIVHIEWQSVECQTLFCSYNEYLIFKFGFSIRFIHSKYMHAYVCFCCTCYSRIRSLSLSISRTRAQRRTQMCWRCAYFNLICWNSQLKHSWHFMCTQTTNSFS